MPENHKNLKRMYNNVIKGSSTLRNIENGEISIQQQNEWRPKKIGNDRSLKAVNMDNERIPFDDSRVIQKWTVYEKSIDKLKV